MPKRKWILGLLISFGVSLLISAAITYNDWCLNPGGIFQNEQSGTQWAFVWETFFSWFFPLFVLISAILLLVMLIVYRIRRKA